MKGGQREDDNNWKVPIHVTGASIGALGVSKLVRKGLFGEVCSSIRFFYHMCISFPVSNFWLTYGMRVTGSSLDVVNLGDYLLT